MPLVWLDVECVRLSVCIDAGVLKMAAHMGSYGGMFRVLCAVDVVCMC